MATSSLVNMYAISLIVNDLYYNDTIHVLFIIIFDKQINTIFKYLNIHNTIMKTTEFNDYLYRNNIHVFTIADAAKIIGKPKAYTSLFLFRNKSLKRAERGIYYTKEATEYEIASNIVYPSYISLISALRFYNLTEQIPNVIYVVTTKRHKPIEDLNGYVVEFRNIKKERMFGYRKVDGAFVADPEKAVIDMVYLNLFREYADEVLEGGKINLSTLSKYIAMSKVNTVKEYIDSMTNGQAIA